MGSSSNSGSPGSLRPAAHVVKPDKKQRAMMQSMSAVELLDLFLHQVFQRTCDDGLLIESFSVQQQIHREISKQKAELTRLSPSAARNMQRLLSRMSWTRMLRFLKMNPKCDHGFLDYVGRELANLRAGDVSDLRHVTSAWL